MPEFKVALKAVVQKDGKILVLKRAATEDCFADLWDIPGGKIEFGEKPNAALQREVMEETGLLVSVGQPWTIWTFMSSETKQTVGITLLAEYAGGEVKLSEEHTDYRWIKPAEFADFDAHPNLKAEIAKFANK